MKRVFLVPVLLAAVMSSCVSKKKYSALEDKQQETENNLSTAKLQLAECLDDKKNRQNEIEYLKSTNYQLLNNIGNLSVLSTKEAQNLEKSLESLQEKDLQIKSLNEAVNKKDSITLALVTSLKSVLGDMSDEDIQINVEKGVVYVSISDKLLFRSGSYEVSAEAKKVLAKVAKVVNNKPNIDIMVEGHTDNKSISNSVLVDNWDLSVKRATSVVRVLQNDYSVDPKRMTAAGRSYYIPLKTNETAEGRAANRRTRIIILPKLDEFSKLIEDGMKEAESK